MTKIMTMDKIIQEEEEEAAAYAIPAPILTKAVNMGNIFQEKEDRLMAMRTDAKIEDVLEEEDPD